MYPGSRNFTGTIVAVTIDVPPAFENIDCPTMNSGP
jgi:hypothetical protein